MILSWINQNGGSSFDYILFLFPILCCMMSLMQRRENVDESDVEKESWYTSLDINSTFNEIETEILKWKEENKIEKNGTFLSKIKKTLIGESTRRFIIEDKEAPRLLVLSDNNGQTYFELVEVESGGTVVKTTFNTIYRNQLAKFKARLPLKIPVNPIGLNCPSCGKPILKDFNICPYCGDRPIKE